MKVIEFGVRNPDRTGQVDTLHEVGILRGSRILIESVAVDTEAVILRERFHRRGTGDPDEEACV